MLHQTFVTPCRSPSDRLNCDPIPPSLPFRPHSPPSLLRPHREQDQRTIPNSGYLKHSPFNDGAEVRTIDRHCDFKPPGTMVRHPPVKNMVYSKRQLPSPDPLSSFGSGIAHPNTIHSPVSPHLLHSHSPLNLHNSRAQIYRPHNHGIIPDGRQNNYQPAHNPVSTVTALDSHFPGTFTSRTTSPLCRTITTTKSTTTTTPVRSIAVASPRGMPSHPTSHLSYIASYPKVSEFSPSSPRMSMNNKSYLTSSPDDSTGLRPFQISDISSVQPSSFSERSRDRGFSSFSSPQGEGLSPNFSENESRSIKWTTKRTKDEEEFGYRGAVPFRIRSIHPQQRNNSSYPWDGGGSSGGGATAGSDCYNHTPKYLYPGNRKSPNRHHNNEAQTPTAPHPAPLSPAPNHSNHYHPNHHHHHHYNHLHSHVDPFEGGESTDSSNQPFGYTRERFQKTVECVRQVPAHRPNSRGAVIAGSPHNFEGLESQPPYRSSQFNDNNSRKVPSSHNFYSPRVSLSASGSGHYSAHNCRSKLHLTNNTSKGHHREGPQEESHTSMSSSGRGSILGRGHYPDVCGRASIKVDTLPDSYSSGLGSRSTSHSVPSSSSCGQLRAGPPMEMITSASSLTFLPHDYDVSIDSSPFLDASTSNRRDLSGDENYEFDSMTTTHDTQEVVGPALVGPRASAGHPYSTPDMVSPPELLLNAKDLYYSLYPKSRKPSRYSNSEKRFERLREEYYEYRRRQLLHSQPRVLLSMDSEML